MIIYLLKCLLIELHTPLTFKPHPSREKCLFQGKTNSVQNRGQKTDKGTSKHGNSAAKALLVKS